MITNRGNKSGFTLLEMSIVLVIIGLIVGGVMTGKSLIASSKIQNVIAQIQRYNTAVRAFQGKYDNALPGDISPVIASQVGLFALTGTIAGTTNHGDNDSQVDQNYGVDCGEEELFWMHLTEETLIPGQYGTQGGAALIASTDLMTSTSATVDNVFPSTKLDSVYMNVSYNSSMHANAFNLTGYVLGAPAADTGCRFINANVLSPNMEYAIDKKMDDGMPATGTVVINGGTWNATPVSNACTYGGASGSDPASLYNRTTSYGDILSCSGIGIRFQ